MTILTKHGYHLEPSEAEVVDAGYHYTPAEHAEVQRMRDQAAYDFLIQAMGGMMSVTGEAPRAGSIARRCSFASTSPANSIRFCLVSAAMICCAS
mgnify:CR=1 FL=1